MRGLSRQHGGSAGSAVPGLTPGAFFKANPSQPTAEHCQTHGCYAFGQPAAPHGQAGAGLPEHNGQKAGCSSKASGGGLQARPVRCHHCTYATSHESLNVTVLLVCEITQAVKLLFSSHLACWPGSDHSQGLDTGNCTCSICSCFWRCPQRCGSAAHIHKVILSSLSCFTDVSSPTL